VARQIVLFCIIEKQWIYNQNPLRSTNIPCANRRFFGSAALQDERSDHPGKVRQSEPEPESRLGASLLRHPRAAGDCRLPMRTGPSSSAGLMRSAARPCLWRASVLRRPFF
jgi:hypothetical protein